MSLPFYCRAGFFTALISVLLNFALSGCAQTPPPKPTVLEINVLVADNVNPDARGRASPIVMRLFELKSLAIFQSADYFSLFDRDKESLGNDLVAKEELVLRPGENRQLTRELHPDSRFVAVVSGYRDLERSRWRAWVPVTLNKTTSITVSIQQREISITQK